MNPQKLYLILATLLLVSLQGVAQNTVEKGDAKDKVLEMGPQNTFLNSPDVSFLESDRQGINNNIFITQIGAGHLLNVKTNTGKSDIELVQNGNDNVIRIDITALNATDMVRQQGDNHFFAEYANSPNLNLQRTINQDGNGQNLVIHGNNSISEKIQLNMQGNSKTVVIRNFN